MTLKLGIFGPCVTQKAIQLITIRRLARPARQARGLDSPRATTRSGRRLTRPALGTRNVPCTSLQPNQAKLQIEREAGRQRRQRTPETSRSGEQQAGGRLKTLPSDDLSTRPASGPSR